MDADLDVSVALALLLAVVIELIIRFREYSQWPYLAYALCNKHNPDGYVVACMRFFQIPDEQIDEGSGFLFGGWRVGQAAQTYSAFST